MERLTTNPHMVHGVHTLAFWRHGTKKREQGHYPLSTVQRAGTQ